MSDAGIAANPYEITFSWPIRRVLRRIRIQRALLNACQGRALTTAQALDLVRSRVAELGAVIDGTIGGKRDHIANPPVDFRPVLSRQN